jgi:glutaminyl-tRNA synthetase
VPSEPAAAPRDFIREKVAADVRAGKWGGKVVTRFPPEPNGYLHVGHAKAVWINYSIARDFGGEFHLRFDDTNPVKEEAHFAEAIQEDVAWLGCHWGQHLYYASDYFEQMYAYAVELIRKDKAYVDDLTAEQIRDHRGTLTTPGRDSPYRGRPAAESLELFERMKAGEFPDGSRTLRAKIDMAHPNLNLRDPVMYRILHAVHPHRGDAWCIYPMYDWAHGLEDSIEGVTHSLCSIEFQNHRPLYAWFLAAINEGRDPPIHVPEQTEFARYNLTHTAMSKRLLRPLVAAGAVRGWDDPRMPTLRGMRRRGYTPEAVRDFSLETGVSRYPAVFDVALLEHHLRQDLNRRCDRRMAVLRPLRLVIDNYPEGPGERLEAVNNPENPAAGTRRVPFAKVLYIERDDFMEEPPKKFFRLAPGREVRLRYAYFVTCTHVVKDDAGEVAELHATYDPATRGGGAPDGRKVKATLHWVSATHAADAEVRLYDHLFSAEDPAAADADDPAAGVNPDSLKVLTGCKVEPALADAAPGYRCQFERLGYFCADPDMEAAAAGDASRAPGPKKLIFNRTATLKQSSSYKNLAGSRRRPSGRPESPRG